MLEITRSEEPCAELLDYLSAGPQADQFAVRRRAILTKSREGSWTLICCAVQAFPDPLSVPQRLATRLYPSALLWEDWLSAAEALTFVNQINNRGLHLGDISISRPASPSWVSTHVFTPNMYMDNLGHVVTVNLDVSHPDSANSPLIAINEPYYPDSYEAARNWLGFSRYNGPSDSRNQHVVFLLPELRAGFKRAVSQNNELTLSVGGFCLSKLSLFVKGAYWQGGCIHQFTSPVQGKTVTLAVPDDIDRLEYLLIDSDSKVYDFQYERPEGYSLLLRERPLIATQTFEQLVDDACTKGEGERIEFKKFVSVNDKLGAKSDKTKYRELVMTIVAFANTVGGTAYLGIDDTCRLVGVQDNLAAETKSNIDDVTVGSFCQSIKAKIVGDVYGNISLEVAHGYVDNALIVTASVSKSEVPVSIVGDSTYWVRSGASNRQLRPNEWVLWHR